VDRRNAIKLSQEFYDDAERVGPPLSILAIGEGCMNSERAEVVHADCLEYLPTLNENSIDACIQDPPYGLAFMQKNWDYAVPGPEFFEAQLRVLKPGGYLVAFGGTRTHHRLMCAIEDAGFELRDCLMWLYGQGFPKSHNLKGDYKGWGTALKPAWEPIILARKPFKGTVVNNMLEYGTGALNIDATRIGTETVTVNTFDDGAKPFGGGAGHPYTSRESVGRWPANLILDPEAGAMLDAQTGTLKSGAMTDDVRTNNTSAAYGEHTGNRGTTEANSGGASRFFYCAKANKKEREAGLEDFGSTIVNDGRVTSIDNPYQRGDTLRRNTHPTVKPIELMRYLCRLVTPPNGLILDPFCGSGSTGCAAVQEGFRFLGIDCEQEYVTLAQARLKHWEGSVPKECR